MKLFVFLILLLASAIGVSAEDFQRGILPQTNQPRTGNNFTVVTESGERFEGRAWYNGPEGYFCMSGQRTSCGGTYDARTAAQSLKFKFQCLDGRSGEGRSLRSSNGVVAEALIAEGQFYGGADFVATFGPTKIFRRGVGCWH